MQKKGLASHLATQPFSYILHSTFYILHFTFYISHLTFHITHLIHDVVPKAVNAAVRMDTAICKIAFQSSLFFMVVSFLMVFSHRNHRNHGKFLQHST